MDEQRETTERLSEATHEADRRDAQATHQPDRMPTPEEEQAADELELDPEVAKRAREAAERGANQQGEGRITG
jgi:hypothetical protein